MQPGVAKAILVKVILTASLLVLITACGESNGQTGDAQAASSESSASTSDVEGEFTVEVSNGTGFGHESERASIEVATDNMIGLKASGWHVRVHARELPESGPGETTEFGRNNTIMSLYVDIDGERKRVGCDPADPEQGTFTRTELTDTHVSGSFTLEFVSCDDYYSAESVDVPGLPFTVTGSFSQLQRTN